MSTTTFCDRCGAEGAHSTKIPARTPEGLLRIPSFLEDRRVDFCNQCRKELVTILEEFFPERTGQRVMKGKL